MALVLTVQQKWQIKMVMLTILLIQYHNSIREHTYLLRAAVVRPSLSPWRYLYDHGDDSSFLHLTGMTREAFIILQNILFPPESPLLLLPDDLLLLLLLLLCFFFLFFCWFFKIFWRSLVVMALSSSNELIRSDIFST